MPPIDAPTRVLAVYAHPDDPEVSCAGTLARWVDAGTEVHVLICTRGDKGSNDATVDPEQLVVERLAEMRAAGAVLGVAGQEVLDHADGELENTVELRAELVARIRQLRPDVVVGPDPTAVLFGSSYVNHHDHRSMGFALLDACAPAAASPLYFPETGPAHQVREVYLSGTLHPDTWIDIEATVERKVAALACHVTQLGADVELTGELVRRRAASAGTEGGHRFAEAFRVLRLS